MNLQPKILSAPMFCAVLRYVLQCDDLTRRQSRLVGDVVAMQGCPYPCHPTDQGGDFASADALAEPGQCKLGAGPSRARP